VNVCLEDPPSGFIKEAMTFDGIASSIEAPQPPCNVGGDEGLTVAAWVKRSKDDVAWDRLIDFGNGAEKENVVISFQEQTMYEVRNGDGVLQLAVGTFTGPGASTQMSFPSDRWMHIALVHDKDGIASIYWNGALKARGPVWLPPPVHREKYYVGRSHWTHDPYFKGEISDVHVFNYALNHHEVDKACFSRSLPTGSRGKPILSLASGWRTDAPRKLPVLSWPSRGPTGHSCGCHGCGGFGHCGGGGGAEGNPLQFFTGLGDEHKRHALSQLQRSFQEQKSRISQLVEKQAAASARGAVREADAIQQSVCISLDALRRAQAVERMIRYSMPEHNRMPTALREEASTGQLLQPPQIAAAFDATSGVFHAFAIYELRSGSKADRILSSSLHAASDRSPHEDYTNRSSLATACWTPAISMREYVCASRVPRPLLTPQPACWLPCLERTGRGATAIKRREPTPVGTSMTPPAHIVAAAATIASAVAASVAAAEIEAPAAAATTLEDVESSMEWHVYISELVNMRHLIPGQTCWRPRVGGLLVNLLQRQGQADRSVVVLKPIHDAKPGTGSQRLDSHYARIGFTPDRAAFTEAGLSDSYHDGEYILS